MHSTLLHRLFWGMVLVGVGAVFLLNQIGVTSFDIGDLISVYWPIFIILFGVQGLLLQSKGSLWWNPIVVMVGVFFLGKNLGWFQWELSDMLRFIGPVVLIIYGLCLMTRGGRGGRRHRHRHRDANGWNPVTPPPVTPSQPSSPAPDDMPLPPPPPPMPYDSEQAFGPASAAGGHDSAAGIGGTPGAEAPKSGPAGEAGAGTGAGAGTEAGDYREMPGGDPRAKDGHYWKHQYWKEHHHEHWKNGWKHQRDPHWEGHYRPFGCENHNRFIGDVHIGQDYFELRPMSISHFIGDTKLDLTRAQIPLGETKIYVSSFIGDVKVFVPNDFSVGIRVVSSSLIGDVTVMEQKRGGIFNQMNVETNGFTDAAKQVVIIVSTFIGDVRVTKVG